MNVKIGIYVLKKIQQKKRLKIAFFVGLIKLYFHYFLLLQKTLLNLEDKKIYFLLNIQYYKIIFHTILHNDYIFLLLFQKNHQHFLL